MWNCVDPRALKQCRSWSKATSLTWSKFALQKFKVQPHKIQMWNYADLGAWKRWVLELRKKQSWSFLFSCDSLTRVSETHTAKKWKFSISKPITQHMKTNFLFLHGTRVLKTRVLHITRVPKEWYFPKYFESSGSLLKFWPTMVFDHFGLIICIVYFF